MSLPETKLLWQRITFFKHPADIVTFARFLEALLKWVPSERLDSTAAMHKHDGLCDIREIALAQRCVKKAS